MKSSEARLGEAHSSGSGEDSGSIQQGADEESELHLDSMFREGVN